MITSGDGKALPCMGIALKPPEAAMSAPEPCVKKSTAILACNQECPCGTRIDVSRFQPSQVLTCPDCSGKFVGIEFADYHTRVEVPGSAFVEGFADYTRQVRFSTKTLSGKEPVEKLIIESVETHVAPVFVAITGEVAR